LNWQVFYICWINPQSNKRLWCQTPIKMNEKLIIAGGIFNLALIIFHLMFWRIFKWPETISSLSFTNKATIQVLNISITFIFFIFSYISFAHTQELITTPLGNSLLVLMSILWLFRALQQIWFYKLKHIASIGLTIFFIIGAALYGIPVIT